MNRSRVVLVMLMTMVLVGIAVTAWAQEGQRRRRGRSMMGGRGSDSIRLLARPEVQKELELVDEQKEKLKKLGEELRENIRKDFAAVGELKDEEARRKKWQEIRQKYEEQAKEMRKKVETILLPHQVDRLKEIQIQAQGARALGSAEVAKALGITDEQKGKLEKIREEIRGQIGKLWQGIRDLDEEQRRAKIEENRNKMRDIIEKAKKDALGVLSDEQRKTFEKMQGKKFELQPYSRSR